MITSMDKHKHVLRENIGKQENKSIQCFIQKSDFSSQTNDNNANACIYKASSEG